VSRRTDTAGTAGGGRVFQWLGDVVVRWPWVVIGCWLALAVALPLTFPSLKEMSEKHPVAILPADAPAAVAARAMTAAFHQSGSENVVVVVLTNDKGLGLGPADEVGYRKLVDTLRKDSRDVVMLQDFITTPPLREVMTSKDHKAWILPVGLAGELTSPSGKEAFARVADIVRDTETGPLTANLTGPAATVADLNHVGERDKTRIELAITILVFAILLIIYRNPVTMLLPLITIGISLVVAQAVVAGLGQLGLGIANQTIIFMSGMMVGAGTDYAVFLISRYHDYLRLGTASDQAVKRALTSIGKVIAASAATVALTFLGMVFARLGVFSTVGPALAAAVGVAFLAAVTLLPAILVIAGRRGWIAPGRDLTSRFWRRSGVRIVRRPRAHLVASLIVLLLLAGCVGLVRYNYDDRKTLPSSVDSSVGYAALEQHFPINSIIPEYVFIQSPHDLRTPQALADLEQMAQRISQLPGIERVTGITRPTGETLEQAKLSYQAGEVGGKLVEGSKLITDRTGDLNRLANGADTLADSLGNVRGQVTQAVSTVRGLVDALSYMQNAFGGDKALKAIDNAAKLITGMRALGDAIATNLADVANGFDWAGPVLSALDASPICAADPLCSSARIELQRVATALQDGTLDKIGGLAQQLRSTQNTETLSATTAGLRRALDIATGAMRSMGLNSPGSIQSRLATLQQGANTIADASRQVADGVQLLVDETKQMGARLGDASAFLLAMKNDATTPAMAGFYVPPQVLNLDEFKKVAAVFIAPDGHAVRYLVQTKLNPFSTEAMNQVNAITDTARGAQPNTTLSDASISMAGFPVMLRDTREYYNHDIRFIIFVTISVVLMILIALLRALIAPLYLICSVVVSYLSALGIGVVVFQFMLGQELHWSVPGMTFIILVAVGADYNMLLISRIRDESPHGVRSGVIRTVGSTGGVITAAGLIFAASMFGLVFSSLSNVVQGAFVVGIGLLLDTFLVRTITVPAMAVLVGRANWWPSRRGPRPHSPVRRAELPAPDAG
jgi:RND superfamily putative drug exporter